MKLRFCRDSLRLRVGPSEAAAIAAGRVVHESVSFGTASQQSLVYSVEGAADAESVRAAFESNRIRVLIPLQMARSWHDSDQVSVENAMHIDQTRSLKILIEKDFECRKNPAQTRPKPIPIRGAAKRAWKKSNSLSVFCWYDLPCNGLLCSFI